MRFVLTNSSKGEERNDELNRTSLIQTLGWTLLHFLWQGTLVAALYGLTRLKTANRLTARARYGTACAGFSRWHSLPAATYLWLAREASTAATAFELTPLGPRSVALGAWTPATADPWQQALPWIVMVWLAGVGACSIRLAGGWLSAARLHTSSNRPAPLRVAADPGTSHRPHAHRPTGAPVGLIARGVTVHRRMASSCCAVAARSAYWPGPQYVEALLAHELAHIRRHDYLVNVLQGIAESCSSTIPRCGGSRARSAPSATLLRRSGGGGERRCAHLRPGPDGIGIATPAHLNPALAANDGSLVRRIRRLVDPGAQAPSGWGAAWVLSVLMLLAVGTAIMHGAPEPAQPPTVDLKTVWPDTVKQGDMVVAVRGLGTITSTAAAELRVAETQVKDVRAGQPVLIDCMGKGMVAGRVTNVLPAATEGTVPVDVRLDGALPQAVGLHAKVDATITIRNLTNVVYVGRPVFGRSNSRVSLFKIEPDDRAAVRVKVQFGESSVNVIEVKSGLQPGDKVILSDMSAYDKVDRINLK